MHLDLETIARFVDGELTADEMTRAADHLDVCEECAETFSQLSTVDDFVWEALAHADPEPPRVDAGSLIGQARRRSVPSWMRWAAALALTAVGAGAAYAAPGSPLPGWLGRADSDPGPSETQGVERIGGIVMDDAEPLSIRIDVVAGRGQLVITTDTGQGIAVETSESGATFDSDIGRVVVVAGGTWGGDVLVNVPPTATSVTVALGSRVVWRQVADDVDTDIPEGPAGTYRMPLAPVGR